MGRSEIRLVGFQPGGAGAGLDAGEVLQGDGLAHWGVWPEGDQGR